MGSPDEGAPSESQRSGPAGRRAALSTSSAAGPVLLALTTVAAIAAAVLALLPAALRRRPAGRTTDGADEAPAADAAGEPAAR